MPEQALTPDQIASHLHLWINNYFLLGQDDLIINELGFYNEDANSTVDNSFRADVVLAGNNLIGFEIKSERDSLKRWHTQMIAYPNVFDETWLCVHEKHLNKSMDVTPEYIGLLCINNKGSIKLVRAAIASGLNNTYDLSSMLWKEELVELACCYDIKITTRMNKREIRRLIESSVPIKDVCDYVISRLKVRKSKDLPVTTN